MRLRGRQRAGVLGRVSIAAAPRASAITSAISPRSSRSAPPSSASALFSWLCINAKEAENVSLSREVIALIPEFLNKPNVLGIGEIGLNKNTRNEAIIFQEHVDLAMKTERADPHPHAAPGGQVQGHADDHRHAQGRLAASIRPRVLIDHVEEHTVRLALDNGFWCGMTLYPTTKCTPQRAVDILEMVGTERIMANSAGDWGKSDPLAVPELILEMRGAAMPRR